MPNYDYECERCNNIFTINRPMSESSKPYKCPVCEVECSRKFTQSAGFILKGSGWASKEIKKRKK